MRWWHRLLHDSRRTQPPGGTIPGRHGQHTVKPTPTAGGEYLNSLLVLEQEGDLGPARCYYSGACGCKVVGRAVADQPWGCAVCTLVPMLLRVARLHPPNQLPPPLLACRPGRLQHAVAPGRGQPAAGERVQRGAEPVLPARPAAAPLLLLPQPQPRPGEAGGAGVCWRVQGGWVGAEWGGRVVDPGTGKAWVLAVGGACCLDFGICLCGQAPTCAHIRLVGSTAHPCALLAHRWRSSPTPTASQQCGVAARPAPQRPLLLMLQRPKGVQLMIQPPLHQPLSHLCAVGLCWSDSPARRAFPAPRATGASRYEPA